VQLVIARLTSPHGVFIFTLPVGCWAVLFVTVIPAPFAVVAFVGIVPIIPVLVAVLVRRLGRVIGNFAVVVGSKSRLTF
jgi:hypothetical protein